VCVCQSERERGGWLVILCSFELLLVLFSLAGEGCRDLFVDRCCHCPG
jgi:hypothetical protein